MIEPAKVILKEADRTGAVGIMTPTELLRNLIGEVERLDKQLSIYKRMNVKFEKNFHELNLEKDELRKALEEANHYKSALRKIVCLNIPMPDEVFNIANNALERSQP